MPARMRHGQKMVSTNKNFKICFTVLVIVLSLIMPEAAAQNEAIQTENILNLVFETRPELTFDSTWVERNYEKR